MLAHKVIFAEALDPGFPGSYMRPNIMEIPKLELELQSHSHWLQAPSPTESFSGDVLVFGSWEAEAKDGMVVLSETGVCYGGWPTPFCAGRGLGSSLCWQQLYPSPFLG